MRNQGVQRSLLRVLAGRVLQKMKLQSQWLNSCRFVHAIRWVFAASILLSAGMLVYADINLSPSPANTGAFVIAPTRTAEVVEAAPNKPTFLEDVVRAITPHSGYSGPAGVVSFYDEAGSLISEVGTGGTGSSFTRNYVYLPTARGPMPIAVQVNGEWFSVHSDQMNAPRRLTNARGQVVWQRPYSAFGEDEATVVDNRFADPRLASNPGKTNITAPVFNLRDAGQYWDDESGLIHNGDRSYCPQCCRYIQPDAMGLNAESNRYEYAFGNPLGFSDPDGFEPKSSKIDPITFTNGGGGGRPRMPMSSGIPRFDAPIPFCAPPPAASARAFSEGKRALVDMARSDKKTGMTAADLRAYRDLNSELPDPFAENQIRGPEAHLTGAPSSRALHGHVGPVDHIPIRKND